MKQKVQTQNLLTNLEKYLYLTKNMIVIVKHLQEMGLFAGIFFRYQLFIKIKILINSILIVDGWCLKFLKM